MKAEIKNLKKAAERIKKAVKNKEKIIIYGDSDMDGVTSVIILGECVRNLGANNPIIYFLDREIQGYGINKPALGELKKYAPALLISVDCGIGNFKEVEIAKKLKLEVIIIDHHEILDNSLPKAKIVVDPKQKGDKYPFKQFAAVGIIFRLANLLLGNKMTEGLKRDFSELAALGTIADMMPKTDDNEEIIIEGLSSIKKSWRPGIQVLFELALLESLSLNEQVNKINSLLNIRDIKEGLPSSYRLLTISNIEEAGEMVEKLLQKSIIKKRKVREMLAEIERRDFLNKENVVFEGDSSWDFILLGLAAGIFSRKSQKPVFLYKKIGEDCQGSVRTPEGFNVVEAMKSCSKLLATYGGHPKAAGFKVKTKNLEKFKQCLIDYYEPR